MQPKTYSQKQYLDMKRELTRAIENSDTALIKVLTIITRLRRLAVDGSIYTKIPEVIELCDIALELKDRVPGDMPGKNGRAK